MPNLISVLAAGAFALVTVASQAQAQEAPEGDVRKMAVTYRDIDLTQPKGQKILQRRINHAIDVVCATPNLGSRVRLQSEIACRTTARADTGLQMARAIASSSNPVRVASANINVAGQQ